jgi:hypothetical protein
VLPGSFESSRTLKEAKYKLRTSTGVSEDYYSHCHAFPIYGTSQGSGNSPVIWCIVSSTLFKFHEERSHGAIFALLINQLQWHSPWWDLLTIVRDKSTTSKAMHSLPQKHSRSSCDMTRSYGMTCCGFQGASSN